LHNQNKNKPTTFNTTGGHTWMNARLFLAATAQLLFQ
jgi:hypothetical protein